MKRENISAFLEKAPVPSTFTLETHYVTSMESGRQVLAARITGEDGEADYELFGPVTSARDPQQP